MRQLLDNSDKNYEKTCIPFWKFPGFCRELLQPSCRKRISGKLLGCAIKLAKQLDPLMKAFTYDEDTKQCTLEYHLTVFEFGPDGTEMTIYSLPSSRKYKVCNVRQILLNNFVNFS